MANVQDRLLKIQAQLVKNSADTETAIKLLNDSIETTAAKFKKYESELVKLSSNLTMVKSRGSGGSTN